MTATASRHNGPMADLVVCAPEYDLHVVCDEIVMDPQGNPLHRCLTGWAWHVMYAGDGDDDDLVIAGSIYRDRISARDAILLAKNELSADHDIDAFAAIYIHRGDYTPVQRVES